MAELDDIVLENLRHIRGAIDDVRDDIRKMRAYPTFSASHIFISD